MATIVKNPAGTWKAVIRKQGWPTTAKTFRTRRDADDWARQSEDEMVRGVYIRRSTSQKLTVDIALDRYLREITPTKKASSQKRDHTSAKAVRPRLGPYALVALSPEIIGQYRDERLAAGRAGNTVRLELALLSHLFSVAIREWGVGLPGNPVLTVRKPKGRTRDRRLHGDDEAARLLQAVRAHSNPILAWATELAIETAARVEEILTLELRDVHLDRRIMVLRDTKNKDTRGVPLTARATEILREAIATYPRQDSPLIFPGNPGRDGVRHPYCMSKAWKNALERAEIQGLHFHDLRHEATSRFVEKGLSDTKVRAITGHKSPQMLARYAHLRAEDLVAELDDRQGHPTVSAPIRLKDYPQNTGQSAKIVPFRPLRAK